MYVLQELHVGSATGVASESATPAQDAQPLRHTDRRSWQQCAMVQVQGSE